MDPYLERHWEDVHQSLAVYSRDAIQPHLPEDLWARAEQRVFVEADAERMRHIIPDLDVSRIYPPSKPHGDVLRDGVTVTKPVVFDLHEPLIAEGYIEILERSGGKVITVIEFLSVANKSGGMGQQKYREKQAEALRSDVSLVEIDLIRAGLRVLALPHHEIPLAHRADYLACVSPGWKRNRRELYPLPLRQRLPSLPIPLRQHEAPVLLDLQAMIDQVYATGRYDRLDYSRELDPPLPASDVAWAESLLKAAGKL